MSKAQQLMARDQQAARTEEEARRKRAEMRQSYGNKFSSINLHRMRQKQTTNAGDVIATKATTMDAAYSKKAPVETNADAPAMPTKKEKDDPSTAGLFMTDNSTVCSSPLRVLTHDPLLCTF